MLEIIKICLKLTSNKNNYLYTTEYEKQKLNLSITQKNNIIIDRGHTNIFMYHICDDNDVQLIDSYLSCWDSDLIRIHYIHNSTNTKIDVNNEIINISAEDKNFEEFILFNDKHLYLYNIYKSLESTDINFDFFITYNHGDIGYIRNILNNNGLW